MKQVAHIRQISLQLRALYGEEIPGSRVNAFPPRPGWLRRRRKNCADAGWDFERRAFSALRTPSPPEKSTSGTGKEPTAEARRQLCLLPGVGRKVANCVLLFAYERLDVVPVDIWIARILKPCTRHFFTYRTGGVLQPPVRLLRGLRSTIPFSSCADDQDAARMSTITLTTWREDYRRKTAGASTLPLSFISSSFCSRCLPFPSVRPFWFRNRARHPSN